MPEIVADLHVHLEHDEFVGILAEAIAPGLDVVAVTNHAHKPDVMHAQPGRIEKLQSLRPDLLLLPGVEWDVLGCHVNVIFPDAEAFAAVAPDFVGRFNMTDDESVAADALGAIAAIPEPTRPAVILNHPGHGLEGARRLAQVMVSKKPAVAAGVDMFHGHQGWPQTYGDPMEYPGNVPGGLYDTLLSGGLRPAATAASDFHVHKQERRPDYAPGQYQWTIINCPDRSGTGVVRGLWAGESYAVQGSVVEALSMTWTGEGLRVCFRARVDLERWEVITGSEAGVAVIGFGRTAGAVDETVPVKRGRGSWARVRGASVSRERPVPGGPYAGGFASSAVHDGDGPW
ncbi:MAG: hypothetical protein JW909_12185 [Planctomycetes bacterium]|nr:hypothetical protein [Planctomycetota bacterium]